MDYINCNNGSLSIEDVVKLLLGTDINGKPFVKIGAGGMAGGFDSSLKVWDDSDPNVQYNFYPAIRADANDLKHGVIEKVDFTAKTITYADMNILPDKDWAHRKDGTYTYGFLTS